MKNKIIIILIVILGAVLRLNQITTLPALNADEAALGYNAYSLIQTGKDEHGQSWPIVFKSFGDYKPGIYIYLAIPFVKLLGLNVLAVRLPGLILSIISIFLIYILVKELNMDSRFRGNDKNDKLLITNYQLPTITALLLAISPWHIHFSRGAWETQTSTAFLLLGVYGFLKALKKPQWYLVFTICFILSVYTYHSMRIIAPLLTLSLIIIFREHFIKIILPRSEKDSFINKINIFNHTQRTSKYLYASFVIGIFLTIPLLVSLLSPSGLSRASGVSIFADPG